MPSQTRNVSEGPGTIRDPAPPHRIGDNGDISSGASDTAELFGRHNEPSTPDISSSSPRDQKNALLPEVLTEISSWINDEETLRNLRLVNKLFNTVFQKKLHERLIWNTHNIHLLDGEKCVQDGRRAYFKAVWAYCRAITIDFGAHWVGPIPPEYNWESKVKAWRGLNRKLAGVIKESSYLRSFSSKNIRLTKEILEPLISAHKLNLQSLTIRLHTRTRQEISDDEVEPRTRPEHARVEVGALHQYLPQFQNLLSLSVVDMVGDLGEWKCTIVDVLVGNPQLEHLSLSICGQRTIYYDHTVYPSYKGEFFVKICDSYTQKNGRGLSLRTLELGNLIHFPPLEILSSLTKVGCLEVVHIHNTPDPIMPWDILHPRATPKLRQLSLQYLDDSIRAGIKDLLRAGWQIDAFQAFEIPDEWTDDQAGKCVSGLFCAEPKLKAQRVLLPGAGRTLFGCYGLQSLNTCNWITNLTVPIGVEEREVGIPEALLRVLKPVFEMVGGMERLVAIWFPYIAFDQEDTKNKWEFLGACKAFLREPFLRGLAGACPTLKYVRFLNSGWRVNRIRAGHPGEPPLVVFKKLEDREDEKSGPDFFRVPGVAKWATYY